MDQKKIGSFIAKLRKSKKMTQQDLADKLNITNRAISNWENGRRMPDISFFKPLCEILDISVNELVNGEKMTTEKNSISTDDTIINTLNINEKNKKKSNKIIRILFLILIILTILLSITTTYYKNAYPKIDIYNLSVSPSDSDKEYILKKQFAYKMNNKKYNVYYYGIDSAQLCDTKDNCYGIKLSLDYKQTNIDKIKKYLESQYVLTNVNKYTFYDGGTSVYSNNGYSIMFCNTLEGNKDIYIGISDMVESLNGAYCGRREYQEKSYIRTYTIIKAQINSQDNEFIDVTLKQNNGSIGTVSIHKTNDIVVGRTYEFTFLTFKHFENNIENIFKYSTLLKTKETDKNESNHLNEDIYVNQDLDNGAELNELEHVSMTIKENTLTNTSATIIINDLSGHKYTYGSSYRIDKKIDNEWTPLESICDNCAFNSMAYGVDKDGKLPMELNWERMYGPLNSGRYRIVKDAFLNIDRPITEKDMKYFSVEFDIN